VNPARLVLPALRWRADGGFAAESPTIERGLARGVGGFILFGGDLDEVRDLTRAVTRQAGRPLLFGADLERGPGQQVTGLAELPPPAALASLGDLDPVRHAGVVTGSEARSVGINWVFAPDADLDLVAANPIVQTRSFGADPVGVAAAVGAWIDGCQSAGAAACAKHFPGHGRTRIDPHDRLPVVDVPADELAATDLVPFRAAIAHRVASIMTAHVGFPALDAGDRPATLSPPVLAMLRRELHFGGAIVSDAMMMGAMRERWSPAEASLLALEAGVDLLLYPPEPWETIAALERSAHDAKLRHRIGEAHARYEALLATVARPGGMVDRAAHARFAARLGDRLMAASDLGRVRLAPPIELVVVDDDQDGAYPASPNHHVRDRLASEGVPLGSGGSVVVLALAEPRASKGRAGFGPASRAALEKVGGRAALVVLFAHPRLQAELPAGVPVLQAWHRQRLMQEAAARAIRARLHAA
jgi:beta-glucosidase